MREINFRGKDKRTGEWHYGYLWKSQNEWFIREKATNSGTPDFEVLPEKIGQFTGLKDKNGKEIFEGDIVNWFADGINKIARIVWKDCGWIAERIDKRGIDYKFQNFIPVRLNRFDGEVIGNIYENPELLDAKPRLDEPKEKKHGN